MSDPMNPIPEAAGEPEGLGAPPPEPTVPAPAPEAPAFAPMPLAPAAEPVTAQPAEQPMSATADPPLPPAVPMAPAGFGATQEMPLQQAPTQQMPVQPMQAQPMQAQPAASSSGKGKRIAIIAAVGVVAAALGFGGGYLSRGGEVDDLTSERDSLLIERNDLRVERDTVTDERDALTAAVADVEGERDDLQAAVDQMEADAEATTESLGVCKDAIDASEEVTDQWGFIWGLQLAWFRSEPNSPEEAAIDEELNKAFDDLDTMYANYEDQRDDCRVALG